MNITKEEILEVVKAKGPIIPLDIKRALGRGDSFVIGAMLSQLISTGEVKITNVKIGGSPFYFYKGQEEKLENLSQYLNEKDRRAFNSLKEKKILRDTKLDPLERVSQRNIPDFSKKLVISINGEKEIFWRYYLISDTEGIEIIKNSLRPKTETSKMQEQKIVEKQKDKTLLKPKEEQKTLNEEDMSEFELMLKKYFDSEEILILERTIIRKNSEYEFLIRMKTPLGFAEFYCKARNKKKVPDGDIADSYLQGLISRSPVVFITNGEVAKKSKDKLKTSYKGMIIKELK